MKILMVSEFFPLTQGLDFSGGVEARNYYVARELAKNHQVTVITSKLKGYPEKTILNGINVVGVGPERVYSATVGSLSTRLKFIQSAISVSKTADADIVEGSNFITHFIAKRISKIKKIPVVAWYPDVWIGQWLKISGVYGSFGEMLERYNLSSGFDAFIAISEQTAKKLRKFIKQKIDVIYCGVDPLEFKRGYKKRNKKTVICIGRLTEYKNQKVLIDAFSKLPEEINAELILVGNGPKKKELEKQVRKLKVNSVSFYQDLPRRELVKLLKSSHVFVLPSLVEGFGIATIEGCAAGLPYVISNIEIHKEVTKNGQGGFLVDPDNSELFTKCLADLLTDKQLYSQKSQAALKLSQDYNWTKIAQQTEEVYKGLI